MAAMTREEFLAETQKPQSVKERSEWAGTAASIVAAIALAPENFSKDGIVEAMQGIALQMDGELLAEAMLRIMQVTQ